MFKKPTLVILSLLAALLFFSMMLFIWQTYQNTENLYNLPSSKVDLSWQHSSKTVDLDNYIKQNQVSQNIIDKKQRVMLEPELINFHGVLQDVMSTTQADLVINALSVWGISPLPEVDFSTYIRSPDGTVIAVYVENSLADYIASNYKIGTVLQFQAYRLYNYAKGPRLLLVGVKPSIDSVALALSANPKSKG